MAPAQQPDLDFGFDLHLLSSIPTSYKEILKMRIDMICAAVDGYKYLDLNVR